jgi:FtsH-binding integral membrane protein
MAERDKRYKKRIWRIMVALFIFGLTLGTLGIILMVSVDHPLLQGVGAMFLFTTVLSLLGIFLLSFMRTEGQEHPFIVYPVAAFLSGIVISILEYVDPGPHIPLLVFWSLLIFTGLFLAVMCRLSDRWEKKYIRKLDSTV